MNTKAISTQSNNARALTFDFAHIYHLLLSKAWLIILAVVLMLLAAVGYLAWAPKVYESRAVIEVAQETPEVKNIQDFNADGAGDTKGPEVLKTIEQALMSETLFLRVIKVNGLDKDPLFAPPKKDGSSYLDAELIARFAGKVSVKVRRGTRLVDVTVSDIDPQAGPTAYRLTG